MELTKNKIIILGEQGDLKPNFDLKSTQLILTFELETEYKLKKNNLPAVYFPRYAQSKAVWESIISSSKDWLQSWPKKSIFNGASILDIFKIKNISLWWFVYVSIWEIKNGIFDVFYYLKGLSMLIEEYNPNKIEVYGRLDSLLKEILIALSEKYNFSLDLKNYHEKLEVEQSDYTSKKFSFVKRWFFLKIANAFAKKSLRKFVIIKQDILPYKRNQNQKILLDRYLEGLESFLDKYRNKILIVLIDRIPLKTNISLIQEFFNNIKGIQKSWIGYYSFSKLSNFKRLEKNYRDKISEIEKDLSFSDSLIFEKIDLFPFLKKMFNQKLPRLFAFTILEIDSAISFLTKEKPDAVFTTDGFSISGKALSLACNEKNLKIVSPQVGIISPELPVNTTFLIDEEFEKKLLPKLLVWGPFYEKLITERGYPSSQIGKVGFWRLEGISNKKSIKSDYILYVAGANLDKLSYILSFDEEIFTIKKIHEIIPHSLRILIKLHPSLPRKKYEKFLVGFERAEIVGEEGSSDIIDLIKNSKIVVGKATTVLIQAIILKKSAICVNFASKLNILGVNEIPFATSPEEFKIILQSILTKERIDYDLNQFCSFLGEKAANMLVKEFMGTVETID